VFDGHLLEQAGADVGNKESSTPTFCKTSIGGWDKEFKGSRGSRDCCGGKRALKRPPPHLVTEGSENGGGLERSVGKSGETKESYHTNWGERGGGDPRKKGGVFFHGVNGK